MPQQGMPFGDAFIVQTPHIDRVREESTRFQQQLILQQAHERAMMNQVVGRELSKIRSADTSDAYNYYNQYKNAKMQLDLNPPKNRADYDALDQQANQALASFYGLVDESTEHNQRAKDLTKVYNAHPTWFNPGTGNRIKQYLETPVSKLNNPDRADLANPDSYRFQDNIDIQKMSKNALAASAGTHDIETIDPNDKFSKTITTYKGFNPASFNDNLFMQLHANPNAMQSAANAMESISQQQLDQINHDYYNLDPSVWKRMTGHETPTVVEPQDPNNPLDQYSAMLTKLRFIHDSYSQSEGKATSTPNREVRVKEQQAFQEHMQQLRFQQQALMKGVELKNAKAKIDYQNLYAAQNDQGKDAMADNHLALEFDNAKKNPLVTYPTSNGGTVSGYAVSTIPDVTKLFAEESKGHKTPPEKILVSPDGSTYSGIHLMEDSKGNTVADADHLNTTSISSIKPTIRNYLAGKNKSGGVIPGTTAAPSAAPSSAAKPTKDAVIYHKPNGLD